MFCKEEKREEKINKTLEELVPKDHLLRKIDEKIDFTFIREITKSYYSQTKGRDSIDPVVLFKIVFLKDLYGIKSMRETIKKIETDVAFRWFLGISFSSRVPHYSTFSQNYNRRYKDTGVLEEIFLNVLQQAKNHGFIRGTKKFKKTMSKGRRS